LEISRSLIFSFSGQPEATDVALSSGRTLLNGCFSPLGGCHFESHTRPVVRRRHKLVCHWMRRRCRIDSVNFRRIISYGVCIQLLRCLTAKLTYGVVHRKECQIGIEYVIIWLHGLVMSYS
jgi:hypothetical protein